MCVECCESISFWFSICAKTPRPFFKSCGHRHDALSPIMAAIASDLVKEFMGPVCLYQILSDRLARNPMLQTRNLYHTARPTVRHSSHSICIIFEFETLPVNGLLTFHVLSKQGEGYVILSTSAVPLTDAPELSIQCKFPVTSQMLSAQCEDLFLLALLTEPGGAAVSRTAHDRWAGTIAKVATDSTRSIPSEVLEIQLPCHGLMIDLHQPHLARARKARRQRSEIRSFMFPASSSPRQPVLFTRTLCNKFTKPSTEGLACLLSVSCVSDRSRKQTYSQAFRRSDKPTLANMPICNGSVLYHCTSTVDKVRKVWYEERSGFQCVWCTQTFPCAPCSDDMQTKKSTAKALHALSIHLDTFHGHFLYDMSIDAKGKVHVLVTKGDAVRRPSTAPWELPILPTDTGDKATARPMDKRQFYHVTTGQQMTTADREHFLNSLENTDFHHPELDLNAYELKDNYKMIEEYVDINIHEQEFMKLWNAHLSCCLPHSDTLLIYVCQRFVQKFGVSLVTKHLRHNFLLHLVTLWDFGLLTAAEVHQLIVDVDTIKINAV